jgi:hypothetical protein
MTHSITCFNFPYSSCKENQNRFKGAEISFLANKTGLSSNSFKRRFRSFCKTTIFVCWWINRIQNSDKLRPTLYHWVSFYLFRTISGNLGCNLEDLVLPFHFIQELIFFAGAFKSYLRVISTSSVFFRA